MIYGFCLLIVQHIVSLKFGYIVKGLFGKDFVIYEYLYCLQFFYWNGIAKLHWRLQVSSPIGLCPTIPPHQTATQC